MIVVQEILDRLYYRLRTEGRPDGLPVGVSFLIRWITNMDEYSTADQVHATNAISRVIKRNANDMYKLIADYENEVEDGVLLGVINAAKRRLAGDYDYDERSEPASAAQPSFMDVLIDNCHNIEQIVATYLMNCFTDSVEPDFGGEAQRLSVIERILKDREEESEDDLNIDPITGLRSTKSTY